MSGITALHHVTCIAGDPQENYDFYSGVLGMRLVKRSVNQDVPGTYHLFYADGEGHAGTDLTFFPWPDMAPATPGVGLASEVGLAVPAGTLDFWRTRLEGVGVMASQPIGRFGERVLTFADPHGLQVALVETSDEREFTPWAASPVAADRQVRGLHSMRLVERETEPTAQFLINTLGFVAAGSEDGWKRFVLPGARSGCIAANMHAIEPPSDAPKITADSLPAASMTARMSSERSSSVGTFVTRSLIPVPRLSNRMRRAKRESRSTSGGAVPRRCQAYVRCDTVPGARTRSTPCPSPVPSSCRRRWRDRRLIRRPTRW